MDEIITLRETLATHLAWHGARLNFLALFLIALIRSGTVNLEKLAGAFRNEAKQASNYKRLQRFFRDYQLDEEEIAKLIVRMMNIPQPWVLSVDRTTWSFGEITFNILVLGIVYQGIDYPVVWEMLKKKGNTKTDERVSLLKKFREIFPQEKIKYISGDREFVGKKWLSHLLGRKGMQLRVRIRESDKISSKQGLLKGSVYFSHLRVGEYEIQKKRCQVWGKWVYVSALRLENRELLIVISNHYCRRAIDDYAERWGIETLFGILKTRGFCLESTHFTDAERLSKLICLLSIALCWAVKTGEWLAELHPIPIKKHRRLAKSIFRYGLDCLRSIFLDLDLKYHDFLFCLNFLSCT